MRVRMHPTSSGHAITHEMRDADNRVSMESKPSPDAKAIAFDITGLTGSMKGGYLRDGLFTIVDGDHHRENWTFIMPDNRAVHVLFELTRNQP
jgi:hypothetical protein